MQRLEQVFKMHGVEAKGVDCPAIDGIIDEAEEIAGEIDDKQVLDAALIAAAQAVEHYEITRYGTLVAWAQAARPQRLRRRAAEEPRRGKGDRPEADRDGGEVGESQGGVALPQEQPESPRDCKSRGLSRIRM